MGCASYKQEAEVAFENMGCPWTLRSSALQDPASVILHERDPCRCTMRSYRAQYKYSTVSSILHPRCLRMTRLEGDIWLEVEWLLSKSHPTFPKGASGQRCRSLYEAEDGQTRCHWPGDLCSTFKSAFKTMSSSAISAFVSGTCTFCISAGNAPVKMQHAR